ncbi:MAG: hypothetical protein LC687_03200, partial [Actinobacteria bacterium]|nr:hypothetical protein [Actinomycetota bacterium]
DETWCSQPAIESRYMNEIPFDEMGNPKETRDNEVECDYVIEPELQEDLYRYNVKGHLRSVS